MQLVVPALRLPPRLVQRVLGGGECLVRVAHRGFGAREPRLSVGERRFARLQIELPGAHLFGERRVGLRKIRKLGAKRLEA